MKKNSKGFFLAETIIMIALVTTVIAFLYPNVSKLYENYINRLTRYDQPQDIYVLRAIEEYITSDAEIYKCFIDRVHVEIQTDNNLENLKTIYYESDNYLLERNAESERVTSCDKYLPSMRIDEANDKINFTYSYPENKDLELEYSYEVDENKTSSITVPHYLIKKPNDTNPLRKEGKYVIELFNQLNDLYISKYMDTPSTNVSNNNYGRNSSSFNKYLRQMKKTTNSPNSYRLIGIFRTRDDKGNIVDERYASIRMLLGD